MHTIYKNMQKNNTKYAYLKAIVQKYAIFIPQKYTKISLV